jgi:type VI secretion system secreted protein Hcp
MASDTYLHMEGFKGDSRDSQHKDWIEAWDLSFGLKQPRSATASSAGGLTTSRIEFKPVGLTKNLDLSSAKLWGLCASGGVIREAVIERFRANGSERVKYLEIRLYDLIVCQIDPYSTDDFMAERVSFVFGKIGWCQTQMSVEGKVLGNTAGGWDLAGNKQFVLPYSEKKGQE